MSKHNPGIAPAHRYLEEEDGEDDWIDKCLAAGMGFKSEEDRQSYLSNIGDPLLHPMFASPEDLKDHPLTEAFEAMKEDNKTKLELALIYKDEGNMFVKQGTKDAKHYDTARQKYFGALQFVEKGLEECATSTTTERDSSSDSSAAQSAADETAVTDTGKTPEFTPAEKGDVKSQLLKIKAQVYSNVAMIELSLRNYRQCVENANSSIAVEPNTVSNRKAYFRKAKALVGLKRYEKAIETCNRVLDDAATTCNSAGADTHGDASALPPAPPAAADAEMRKLLEQAQKDYIAHVIQLNKVNEGVIASNQRREQQYADAWKICRQHNLLCSYATPDHPSQLKLYYPHFGTDGGSSPVPRFPVLLLYPQYNKFDILEGVEAIDEMLAASLVDIFPEPEDDEPVRNVEWDERGEYHISNLGIFIHTHPEYAKAVAAATNAAAVKGSTASPSGSSGSLHGAITTLEEWLTCCKVLHEIKTGNSSFVTPLALPTFDGTTAMTAAPARSVDVSSTKEMLRRRRYYEDQLKAEAAFLSGNAHRALNNVLLNVHLGCTFRQIMNAPGVVLPGGLLTLVIYPIRAKGPNSSGKGVNEAYAQFLKKNTEDMGYSLRYLNPLGQVQDTPLS